MWQEREFHATNRQRILEKSEAERTAVFAFSIINFIASLAYVVYVLIAFGECCAWVLVLPIFHLWIWLYGLGVANVRIDSVGFVYGLVGLSALSAVIDLILIIITVIVFIADMELRIVLLYIFFIVFLVFDLGLAIFCSELAYELKHEVDLLKQAGYRAESRRTKPIRGLVAIWISFDLLLTLLFWVFTALTLRSCCWWIILFNIPHLVLWLVALCSANSRVEHPWLFFFYLALAALALGLDLTALILSASWYTDETEAIFLIWAIFFLLFFIIDLGNLLFGGSQYYEVNKEAEREINVQYEPLESDSKKVL